MARNANDYLSMLKRLLPWGRVWNTDKDSNLSNFLYAQAEELARIDQRFDDLMTEADTRYTNELISNHEADFGLPDECSDPASTLADRRSECHTKLLARGGLFKQYYIDLAAAYGYTIAITEYTPFWCGVGVSGDTCGDQDNIFYWTVTINYAGGAYTYFTSGSSVSGDPLIKVSGIDTLICLITKYKPAHTVVLFNLDGYEFSSAFSVAFDSYPNTSSADWLEGAFSKSFSPDFDVFNGGEFDNSFNLEFNRAI
jgi:uncharacterized protein YmfQ (DUF2313 family)